MIPITSPRTPLPSAPSGGGRLSVVNSLVYSVVS